jgi:hypothetical protein
MKIRIAAVLLASSALSACQTAQVKPFNMMIGSTPVLTTPADIRLVMERPRPTDATPVICAEPSPDVAVALSQTAKGNFGVQVPNGQQIGAGVGGSSAEALGLLAGRTASIVALRDGLYRACEAYANNVLPSDVYGLIVSQYGDILVTLTLGEAAAGAGSAPPIVVSAPEAKDITLTYPTFTAPPDKKASTTPATTPAAGAPAAAGGTPAAAPGAMAAASAADTGINAADTAGAAPAAADAGGAADKPAKADSGANTKDTTTPSTTSAAAVADIAKAYFGSAEARALQATATVCMMEAQRRSAGRSSGVRSNLDFIDSVCGGYVNLQPVLLTKTKAEITLLMAQAEQATAAADLTKFQLAQAQAKADADKKAAADKAAAAKKAAKPKPKPKPATPSAVTPAPAAAQPPTPRR